MKQYNLKANNCIAFTKKSVRKIKRAKEIMKGNLKITQLIIHHDHNYKSFFILIIVYILNYKSFINPLYKISTINYIFII